MKKTIRSLLVSLPLIIAAAPSFAGFQMRIPMEVAGGGSMPNGSITFNNNAETAPAPTEPEVVDPFEPEDPRCDPYATTWPELSYGKEKDLSFQFTQYDETNVSGKKYTACKLKDDGNSNLILTFQDGISTRYYDDLNARWINSDMCDSSLNPDVMSKSTCEVRGSRILYTYNVIAGANGYSLTPSYVTVSTSEIENLTTIADVGSVLIDSVPCENFRPFTMGARPIVYPGMYKCDYSVGYDVIKSKIGKPYINKIYKK